MKPSLFQRRGGVLALATLCCLLWGSAMPGVKTGYELLAISAGDLASQVLFAGARFALAGVLLLMVVIAMGRPVFRLSPGRWRQLALLGLTQTTIQYAFFYIGLAHTTGVKASIMNGRHGVMPAWAEVIGEQGVADVAAFVLTSMDGRKLPEGAKADPAKGSVSHVSPLARALMGKRVGDDATVAGQSVEIVAVD